MMFFTGDLSETWRRFAEAIDLRLVAWGCLSVGAVAATALLLRRFAKGRLVTKCVVWSIVAHLILGALLHDPNKRLPQGNSLDPRDKGPATIRVRLAKELDKEAEKETTPEPAPKEEAAEKPSEIVATAPPEKLAEKPWEMAPSPPESIAPSASPPRESLDAAEIAAAQPSPPPLAPPKIKPSANYSPWKPTVPTEKSQPKIARAPAAPKGLFLPNTPLASDTAPLSPIPSRRERLDIDEHRVESAKSSESEANPAPSKTPETSLAPNLIAEAPSETALPDLTSGERAESPTQKLLLDENGAPASIVSLVKRSPAPTRADGEYVPEILSLRVASNRTELARQFGASEESERAIELALQWLAKNQSSDGRWDADRFGAGREAKIHDHDRHGAGAKADAAMTGLALLAFLGNGQTHLSGGYAPNVKKGLDYLKRIQAADGNLAGEAEYFAQMYSHAMATIAIGEALALTGDESLRPMLQKAAKFTLTMQHPRYGGWRYAAPSARPDDLGDMSQFGWQVMALKSASLSGLATPDRSRQGMLRFMNAVSTGKQGGLAKYYPLPGERPTRTMTAEAACCRFFLGIDETQTQRRECTDFLLEQLPGEGNVDFYYWYYGTLALFQRQGEPWKVWNAALQEQLLDRQSTAGEFTGSWDPDRVWGNYGGRVYSTAFAALCLEVYYRYLPVYHSASKDSPHPNPTR